MKHQISKESVAAVQAFVRAHPGCTASAVADAVFGDGSWRSSGRTMTNQILRVLTAIGWVETESTPARGPTQGRKLTYSLAQGQP